MVERAGRPFVDHAWSVTSSTGYALADLERKVLTFDAPGADQLHLVEVPLVPEVRLYLAEDAIVWWARMEAEAGAALAAPFWASAWAGGQGIARYVLDHPQMAAGRRVLDLASGSGLAAIAAGMAGAAAVIANDIDPYALAAITLNAKVNAVAVTGSYGDLLDSDGGDAELVLAGDVFYSEPMTKRVLPFLKRVAARGAQVLVGDPGRDFLPQDDLEIVASYPAPTADAFADSEIKQINVLQLRR
jgi:predicted nicotinamide N-methyase